jgi:hypothetical protein
MVKKSAVRLLFINEPIGRCFAISGQWQDLLSAVQPTFAVLESAKTDGFLACSWLPFKSVSPFVGYLFCFAKISNQQKATPDRSKARNKINQFEATPQLAGC